MIVLDTTTDNLQIVLDKNIATNQLQCISWWRDITTTAYTPWRTVTNTNNTTDVNLVPAPWASTQRVVDSVSIYNNDTVIAQVTIKFDANGTEYIITQVALAPNERLEYTEKKWWRVFTNVWSIKTIITAYNQNNSTSWSAVVTTYDQVNSDSRADTLYPIVWLSLSLEKQKTYYYNAIIYYTSAATTTWCRIIFDVPFSSSSTLPPTLKWKSVWPLTTTTETITYSNQLIWTSILPTSSPSTWWNIAIMEWFLTALSPTTIQAYFTSEIANSAVTIKRWSILFYQEIL